MTPTATLALLRAVGAKHVPYLNVSPLEPVVGSGVVAIGNSRGDFLQGRAGEVRRLDVRAVQASFADGTFELTAALAPGDSGGPVVDEAGNAVGVVSYIAFTPPHTVSGAGAAAAFRAAAVPGGRRLRGLRGAHRC